MSEQDSDNQRPHIEDQDFKYIVVQGITRLETKMDTLIGADGVEGRVPILEREVKSINRKIWTFGGVGLGATAALKYLGTLLGHIGKH
jgi:hypothetical protein